MVPTAFFLLAVTFVLALIKKHDGIIGKCLAVATGVLCGISWFGYAGEFEWLDSTRDWGLFGIAAFFGFLTYVLPSASHTQDKPDVEKVYLGIRYAHGYYYQGATQPDESFQRLDPRIPIQPPPQYKLNQEVPLVFAVANDNVGIPLEDVWLNVRFNKGTGLKVRADGRWQTGIENEEFSFFFRTITQTRLNADAFYLACPQSRDYTGTVTIDAKWIKTIRTEFTIRMHG